MCIQYNHDTCLFVICTHLEYAVTRTLVFDRTSVHVAVARFLAVLCCYSPCCCCALWVLFCTKAASGFTTR